MINWWTKSPVSHRNLHPCAASLLNLVGLTMVDIAITRMNQPTPVGHLPQPLEPQGSPQLLWLDTWLRTGIETKAEPLMSKTSSCHGKGPMLGMAPWLSLIDQQDQQLQLMMLAPDSTLCIFFSDQATAQGRTCVENVVSQSPEVTMTNPIQQTISLRPLNLYT